MGLVSSPQRRQHRPGTPRVRRALGVAVLGASALALSGCSAVGKNEVERLAMPAPIADETQGTYDLWHYSWLAAIIIGVVVWALIGYAVVHFRRRSADEVPTQTRYNLPIEIFYTVAPIMIVVVLFFFTVKVQDEGPDGQKGTPDRTIEVVGQQWSWTFNYLKDDATGGETVFDSGTPANYPTLWLPVNQMVRFNLYSPDVIHDFWVPAFLFKEDVVPGRDNHFQLTPNRIGTYVGKCAELCGAYHSRMLFNVKVVSAADYEAHLKQLQEDGNTGLTQGQDFTTYQPGLKRTSSEGAQS